VPRDATPIERRPSVCPHDCPSACSLEVDLVAPDRIGRVRGGALPYGDGVICAKVARYAERVHHPDRLTRPLVRRGAKGDGVFAEASWDAALDLIAERLIAAMKHHGSQTVWPYFYGGTMGLVQRDGIERLRHAMRWSRQAGTICSAIGSAGWLAAVGRKTGSDPEEMAESDLVVIWGGNVVHTQVHVMNWVQKARKTRGAKLVVVDAYRTATAEKADLHLMPRPGTDAALACAAMHVLFRDGLADRDWMAAHTDDPAALEAHLATRTPAWAEAITGIPAAEIEAFARLYGGTKRSFLRLGYGFTRCRNGAAAMHAAACLPAVTGAFRERGGGALFSATGGFGLDTSVIEGTDLRDPATRVIDMCRLGPALAGDAADLGDGPPVTAMIVQSCNPAATAPDSALVRRGFLRDDLFLAVHEQFMTDTARLADVVLPATTFLEHDDVYVAGGHFALQGHRAVLPPVGEARSNHAVIGALAERLGVADAHPGFRMSALELIDATCRASGIDEGAAAVLDGRWVDRSYTRQTGRRFGEAGGFPTPDGRFRFRADWAARGASGPVARLPALPDHVDLTEAADGGRPFRLITAPARNFLNTSFSETPSSRKGEAGRPTLLVHPDDAAALGLGDGDAVRIGNQRAALTLTVRRFGGLSRGTVVAESIWPGTVYAEGVGINALVGSDSPAPAGGAAFHDVAVWLRPAAAGEAAAVPGRALAESEA